jgi:UDP-glucose 4-epimerase
VTGTNASPRLEPARLGDVHRSVLDGSLIERELGWSPQVGLEEGLARTWAWTKEAVTA